MQQRFYELLTREPQYLTPRKRDLRGIRFARPDQHLYGLVLKRCKES